MMRASSPGSEFRWLRIVLASAVLSLAACGGPEAPPKSADSADTSGASAAAASSDAAADSAPAASDDAWEGEAEATGQAKSGGSDAEAPSAGGPAPPDPKGEETRTTEVIAGVIKGNRQPFRDCYDKGRKELPDLQGTMTLHFVLDAEGKVKTAELNVPRSDIKSPIVVDCAIAVLKGMKFPPSSRGMESTINYPFDFKKNR